MKEPKYLVVYADCDDEFMPAGEGHNTEKEAVELASTEAAIDGRVFWVMKAIKRVGPKEMPVEVTEVK